MISYPTFFFVSVWSNSCCASKINKPTKFLFALLLPSPCWVNYSLKRIENQLQFALNRTVAILISACSGSFIWSTASFKTQNNFIFSLSVLKSSGLNTLQPHSVCNWKPVTIKFHNMLLYSQVFLMSLSKILNLYHIRNHETHTDRISSQCNVIILFQLIWISPIIPSEYLKIIQIISLERNAKNKNFWVQGCYDWSGTNNICFGQKQIEIILQLQIMKSWALLLFFSLSISCPLICICTGKHHHYMIQDNPCWCPVWAWWANETDNQRNADCTNNIQLHTPVCPPASSSLIWYIQCSPALIIISWRHTAFTRLITIMLITQSLEKFMFQIHVMITCTPTLLCNSSLTAVAVTTFLSVQCVLHV